MAVRQYIGARYVPLYAGDWDATKNYEPLTIVTDANSNSFTSLKDVPAGTALIDRDYWIQTSSFSGAVDTLTRRVSAAETEINDLGGRVTELEAKETEYVTPEMFGAVGDGTADDHDALQAAIDTGRTVYGFANYYSGQPLNIFTHGQTVIFDGELKFAGTGIVLSNTTRLNLLVRHLIGNGTGYGIYLHKYSQDGGRLVICFCRIQGVEIDGFEKGIYCHVEQGSGIGIQYNVFDFLRISNTDTAIEYLVNGTQNWCTQQKFSNARLETCKIGVKLISNSDVSNNNVFENIGFESPTSECIVLKNVASSVFRDIRMAENLAASYYIDMENCKDMTYSGDILIAPTKIRDIQTAAYGTQLDAIFSNFYDCERIDSDVGAGYRASKMITNNGAYWYLDQYNAIQQIDVSDSEHILGVTTPSSKGMYYRLYAHAGNTANLIIPTGLLAQIENIWINVSHAGGTEIVTNSAGGTMFDFTNYDAGLYMLFKYGLAYRAIKAA